MEGKDSLKRELPDGIPSFPTVTEDCGNREKAVSRMVKGY
jgi:hypothetical protein